MDSFPQRKCRSRRSRLAWTASGMVTGWPGKRVQAALHSCAEMAASGRQQLADRPVPTFLVFFLGGGVACRSHPSIGRWSDATWTRGLGELKGSSSQPPKPRVKAKEALPPRLHQPIFLLPRRPLPTQNRSGSLPLTRSVFSLFKHRCAGVTGYCSLYTRIARLLPCLERSSKHSCVTYG